jgi:hypothetical protein
MTNPFYNHTDGVPASQTRGVSASIRAEFDLIAAGFAGVANIGGLNSGIDTGTTNSYVVSPSPAAGQYTQFMQVSFIAANTNTGASTINISGLGAKNILRRDGSSLIAGDIQASGLYVVVYDGVEFQLQANPLSGSASGPINFKSSSSIASASTINLDAMTGNYGHITGTTTITAITLAAGSMRQVIFDGVLTLTNGTNLVLPAGANIVTAIGDTATFYGDGSGKVICTSYQSAGGAALVPIAASSFSSVSVINYLTAFSSSYDNYLILLENFTGDGSGFLQMNLAIGGAAIGASNYNYAITGVDSAGTVTGSGSTNAAQIRLTRNGPSASPGTLGGTISIFNANASSSSRNVNSNLSYTNSLSYYSDVSGANLTSSSSGVITGFRLLLSTAGNMSGTIKIFGYQK